MTQTPHGPNPLSRLLTDLQREGLLSQDTDLTALQGRLTAEGVCLPHFRDENDRAAITELLALTHHMQAANAQSVSSYADHEDRALFMLCAVDDDARHLRAVYDCESGGELRAGQVRSLSLRRLPERSLDDAASALLRAAARQREDGALEGRALVWQMVLPAARSGEGSAVAVVAFGPEAQALTTHLEAQGADLPAALTARGKEAGAC